MVARRLADDGHEVVATFRSTPPADLDDLTVRRCDLAEADAVRHLVDEVTASVGPLDVVVSSAAVIRDALLVHTPDDLWAETLEVDLLAQAQLLGAVLPGMVERGWGRVVLISSVAALAGSAAQSAYASAKAAAAGLAREAAAEVAAHGVTVNVVAPGAVDTEQLRRRGARDLDAMARIVPAGRLASEHEVAAAVAFLCSAAASLVNGVILPVDGGLVVGGGFVTSNRRRLRSKMPPE